MLGVGSFGIILDLFVTCLRLVFDLLWTATDQELIAAGIAAGYSINVVKSPGIGYHHTVQVPFPLPMDLAVALSAVFKPMPNPARFPGP